MAFKFVFGDDEGMVYGVTTAGDLLWYRHLSRAGAAEWAKGSGRQIGIGWSHLTQVITGGDGTIYAVDPTGALLWFRHLTRTAGTLVFNPGPSSPGSVPVSLFSPDWSQWANNGAAAQIGSGWNAFTRVFSGGGGVIYGIDSAGDLWWYEHLSGQGVQAWANGGVGRKVGHGWGHFINVFSGGSGVIYAIEANGNLRWYRHLSRDGEAVWENGGIGQQIGTGWNHFSHVFSGGDGVIYAVTGSGDLLWHEHLCHEGVDEWANSGVGQVIGTGWTMPVIEGYCTPLGGAPGETIDFRMSTGADAFTVTFMRLKPQADGSAGIPVADPFLVTGQLKDIPNVPYQAGCGWSSDFSLEVPADWESGIYAAKCEDTEGFVYYVVFIVRPSPAGRRDFAVLANTNTWTAYNDWGGRSQYFPNQNLPLLRILSLERPNVTTSPIDNHQINGYLLAELWVLAWLEDSGYLCDVYTDLDFHQGIAGLQNYKALILNTHPEYWTYEMMDRLETFLSQGGTLLYLGGNGIYERVEYDEVSNTMIFRNGLAVGQRWLFRIQSPARPERAVLGVAYEGDNWSGNTADYRPYTVTMEDHRFFEGTGLHNGDLIGQTGLNGPASGWEMDTSEELPGHEPGAAPANIQVLAQGTNVGPENSYSAQMTYYDTNGGGFVFSAGSLAFGGSLVVDPNLQRIVRNALDECLTAI